MATITQHQQGISQGHYRESRHNDSPVTSSDEDEVPSTPLPDTPDSTIKLSSGGDSYFNPLGLSRTNSIMTLSRASFATQLAQLTSLNLPDASSLSSSVTAIPTASTAAKVLSNAAVQIQRWIQKAAEVLGGLDAEDDVEWAAAGGREGLGEVDAAVGKFEGLVQVYVDAIEELRKREDISRVAQDELKVVVDTMDIVIEAWENVRTLLKGVKEQVERAMEWEELWNVVLGDIGMEMENLSRLVYEMEEKRHKAMAKEAALDATMGLDIHELETIVEESPLGGMRTNKASHRFSLPPGFPTSTPIEPAGILSPQDDSSLLALFARMQPLRASLDFLPMRLSSFHSRAEKILPTACEDLESRRMLLEKKWKKLESDAEALKRELGEDRFLIAFRTAGRQIQKMCESVERSVTKLQEAIDTGAQHNNPAMLAKRVEAYEAKRTHYGPAIPRVLAMIEKGVKDRRTINGEVLQLHEDAQAMWTALEAEIRDMDLSLEDLNKGKTQQLRDSISTIVSNDISATGSAIETPGSSPASSVVMSPAVGKKSHTSTPEHPGTRRSSSITPSSCSIPSVRRNGSVPRSLSLSRTVTGSNLTPPQVSPHPTSKLNPSSATPTPSIRSKRPLSHTSDNGKPRWNSSTKVDYNDRAPKPVPLKAPPPYSRTHTPYRNSRASSSNIALPSPLGREKSASPAPLATTSTLQASAPRSRLSSGTTASPAGRSRRHTSPSPARIPLPQSQPPNTNSESRPRGQSRQFIQTPPTSSFAHKGLAIDTSPQLREDDDVVGEESPSIRAKVGRPSTALGGSRRSSMLPVPKARVGSGRDSSMGHQKGGSLGSSQGTEKDWRG